MTLSDIFTTKSVILTAKMPIKDIKQRLIVMNIIRVKSIISTIIGAGLLISSLISRVYLLKITATADTDPRGELLHAMRLTSSTIAYLKPAPTKPAPM